MFRKLVKKLIREAAKDAARGGKENEPGWADDYREYRDGFDYNRADEYPFDTYIAAIETVKQLKRERRHDEAEDLLLWCIEWIEGEAEYQDQWPQGPMSIPPAYYEHLAIIYRKDDRHGDEVAILERYMDALDKYGHGPHDKMVDRLERARELAAGG